MSFCKHQLHRKRKAACEQLPTAVLDWDCPRTCSELVDVSYSPQERTSAESKKAEQLCEPTSPSHPPNIWLLCVSPL